ncbi:MAG TPA: TIGR00295 family protein [Methanococcaceae archaeon]|uniref:TIGR00295 family protein n=1 Tax=Methanothermococcus okinawensis TaxID=155863 RepID=A0A832ZJ92_9EURY|nr:TIGR00295 family protein [Methanococcaceae archaeon]HIP91139.1 TIGR00295 family protein [Methanothermococcus okinawensis]
MEELLKRIYEALNREDIYNLELSKIFPYIENSKFREYYSLLSTLCSKKIVMHCLAVSLYTYEVGLKLKNRGHNIDLDLAVFGALLHDIGRSRTHTIKHGVEGAKIVREHNLDERLALIVERHIGGGITKKEAAELGLPPRDYIPRTLEEKLVAHCDNLTSGTKRVDINFVVEKYKGKLSCDSIDHPVITRIVKLNNEIISLLLEEDTSHVQGYVEGQHTKGHT